MLDFHSKSLLQNPTESKIQSYQIVKSLKLILDAMRNCDEEYKKNNYKMKRSYNKGAPIRKYFICVGRAT